MKRSIFILIFSLVFSPLVRAQLMCGNDSTGLIPLVDLLTGFYEGHQGGLYPGGVNTIPTSHLNKGLSLVKKLKPLDSLGNVDYVNGKVVLAGFGASTVGGPFNHMINIMKDYNDISPCVKAVNAANGADGITSMYIGNEEYWDYIEVFKLAEKDLTPAQVQVGWLMHSSRTDTNGTDLESYIDTMMLRFTVALNALIYYYPNLKVVFISGFPYGGYADPTKSLYNIIKEPVSYHHNFAVKELIKHQILGDPTLKYKEPGRVAPYIVWGPPLWADGTNPNNYDSLTWNCEGEFALDGGGYHLNDAGKDKLANILLNFFRTDTLCKSWFMAGPKWASCSTGRNADGNIIVPHDLVISKADITIYPNPASGKFYIDLKDAFTGDMTVRVINNTGELVYADDHYSDDVYSGYSLDLTGKPSGIYYVEIMAGGQMFTQPVILNK